MNRRGFATFTAVAMIAVVAGAVAAATAFAGAQWKRGQSGVEEAQLRQYLLAGQVYVQAMLGDGAHEGTWPLPGGGTMRAEETRPLGVQLTVQHAGRTASQQLVYARRDGRIELTAAELGAVSRRP